MCNKKTIIALMALSALAGCNDNDTKPKAAASGSGVFISGGAVAGRILNAKVIVRNADHHGRAVGDVLGSATTDSNGKYKIQLSKKPTGPIRVDVNPGGTYNSESDNSTQTSGGISALINQPPVGNTPVFVTPLSHIQTLRAEKLLDTGASADVGAALNTAQDDLKKSIGDMGLGGQSLTSVAPDFSSNTGAGFKLGVALGVLEQLRKNLNVTPSDLVEAVARDLSDGKPDGKEAGALLQLAGSAMSPTVTTTSLAGAANDYATSTTTVHHQANIDISSQTQVISGAAISEASVSGQLSGSSGAVAPMIVGNKIYVYFAARDDGLVRLDMTDPDHPVAERLATLNADIQTKLPGFSVDGVIPVPTPVNGKQVLLIFNYNSQNLVTVNVQDNTVLQTAQLTEITHTFNVSGASSIYIGGGIADGKRNLVWLATNDGLLPVNPVNLVSQGIIPQPVGTRMDENIGGDPAGDIVFSPNYSDGGIVIFNLAEKKAYEQTPQQWTDINNINGVQHFWSDLDQAAVDSSFKVGVVSDEGGVQMGLVNYATPTGATTDVGIFTPTAYRLMSPPPGLQGGEMAVSVDSASHIVFAQNAWSASPILVAQLDDPAKGANWQGFSKVRYAQKAGFGRPGDPHAIGAFNIAGKAFGFSLISQSVANAPTPNRRWDLLAVDLAAFLQAPADADGILTNDPLEDAAVSKILGY